MVTGAERFGGNIHLILDKGGGRLQLAPILDQDHVLVEMRHLGEQTRVAGLRIEKQGARLTGGSTPSNRSSAPPPRGGTSAEAIGEPACTSLHAWLATRRMMRSTCAGVETHAGIAAPLAQPVEPERAVGLDHHLEHPAAGKDCGDRQAYSGAQHRPAPCFGHGIARKLQRAGSQL